MHYSGELAAISAAIVWAVATWIYSQFSHRFSAMQLNIVKGVIASMMMVVVIPFLPQGIPAYIEPLHLAVLAISGVIGIAVGDSAYFAALKRIGPNKTLLLESLAPPLSGVLAMVFLGSELTLQSWLGVVVPRLRLRLWYFNHQPRERQQTGAVSDLGYSRVCAKPQVW